LPQLSDLNQRQVAARLDRYLDQSNPSMTHRSNAELQKCLQVGFLGRSTGMFRFIKDYFGKFQIKLESIHRKQVMAKNLYGYHVLLSNTSNAACRRVSAYAHKPQTFTLIIKY
jgi:hypothetical protein